MKSLILFLCAFLLFCSATAEAGFFSQLKQWTPSSTTQASLSETQIGKGLKEALSVGIDKAVAAASQKDGYLKNDAIRIRFPENMAMMENALRKIGMGSRIDAFEVGVNRAAEQAAPEAKAILLDALFEMSIEDAQKLLRGGKTAATDYFKKKSWDKLYGAFLPYLGTAMNQSQATQTYNQMVDTYRKIPFAKKPALVSADAYATGKALDGLFYLMAEQEKKIRTDPAARATELLQSVFG